jgi:hypothetical protein
MKIRLPGLILASLLAGVTLIPASYALADAQYRIVLAPVVGTPINIVPPGPDTGGGGLTGNLYIVPDEQSTGMFTTNILTSGVVIFNVLGALQMPGDQVSVKAVRGVFQTPLGTVCDEHRPTITVTDEAPILVPGGLVMVATADGKITGSTLGYKRGRSQLYLKFEVGAGGQAVARAGSFMFELRAQEEGEQVCQ